MAVSAVGVLAITRFFRGRLERGSADVGMLSGMGSDILFVCVDGGEGKALCT